MLLIDAKTLAYATKHTTVDAAMSESDVLGGMVHGYLLRVLDLLKLYPTHRVLFFWDAHRGKNADKPGALLRSLDYPTYKHGRKVTNEPEWFTEAFNNSTLLIEQTLREIGFANHFQFEGYEADDLIAVMASQLTIAGKQCIIVSTDKDLYQLLSPSVSQYNPLSKAGMTDTQFQKDYGILPIQWPLAKALMGDEGDNITGIDGIGVKTACGLIRGEPPRSEKHPVQSLDTMPFELQELVQRNLKLMRLPYKDTPVPDIEDDRFSFYNLLHTLEHRRLYFHLKAAILDEWRTALEV